MAKAINEREIVAAILMEVTENGITVFANLRNFSAASLT